MSLSIDTNILYSASQSGDSNHRRAAAFLRELEPREDVIISELILMELYQLLRNAAVLERPFPPEIAVGICESFRTHPRWQVVGLPVDSRAFHDAMWPLLAQPNFARRKAYDWRTALSLRLQGVDEFATANLRDFEGFGLRRLWNPLAG
jgi:predicted nucleic acid-binding protein